MKKFALLFMVQFGILFGQSNDQQMFKDIYTSSLTNSKCYSWLDDLSNKVGSRLSGSLGAEKGVTYTKAQLETLG